MANEKEKDDKEKNVGEIDNLLLWDGDIATKIVQDPVHGVIHLDPLAVKIINTEYFQRLGNIKQQGFTDYVYPGATHTRFAHSIGVYHLACKMIEAIEAEDLPDGAHKMEDEDKTCIRVAALCHDLGHGPFSHIYEHIANEILTEEERGRKDWKHERLSAKLVETMFQKKLSDELIKKKLNLNLIKALIQGKKEEDMTENEKKKKYMFQIVSNADSGVDVDKWDYFNRDAIACGLLEGFQFDRIVSVARIVQTKVGVFELGYRDYSTNVRICDIRPIKTYILQKRMKLNCNRERKEDVENEYKKWDALTMYNMFHTRFTLHQRIRHKVIIAVDIMMRDVFRFVHEANQGPKKDSKAIDVFPIKREEDQDSAEALKEYIKLSDDILYKIRNHSGDKYKKAKDLLQRLHERKLYKLVTDIPIKASDCKDTNSLYDKAGDWEDAKSLNDKVKGEIQELVKEVQLGIPENIEIQEVKFDYGRNKEDPVSKLYFYRKGAEDKGIQLRRDDVSAVLPSVFHEYHLRVYEKVSQGTEKNVHQKNLEDLKRKINNWEQRWTQQRQNSVQNQVTEIARESESNVGRGTCQPQEHPEEFEGRSTSKKMKQ